MAYSEKVIDHYENPRNVGSMDAADPDVGTGLVGAPACGDVMKLQIRVSDAGVIEEARFKTFGCGSAIAASSLVTEWVKGRTVERARPAPGFLEAQLAAREALAAGAGDEVRTAARAALAGCERRLEALLVPGAGDAALDA